MPFIPSSDEMPTAAVCGTADARHQSSLYQCDGCRKMRRDVKSCGRDTNGDPDGPDLCFICRQEHQRGRSWSESRGKYVPYWEA